MAVWSASPGRFMLAIACPYFSRCYPNGEDAAIRFGQGLSAHGEICAAFTPRMSDKRNIRLVPPSPRERVRQVGRDGGQRRGVGAGFGSETCSLFLERVFRAGGA